MKLLLCTIALVLAASAALAEPPADNVGRHHHPNLAAAQRLRHFAVETLDGRDLMPCRGRHRRDA